MSVIFSGYVSNIWNMFQKLNKLYYGPYIYQLALEISSHETILPQPLKCFFLYYIYYNNSATVTAVRGSGWSPLFNFDSDKAKENKHVIVRV